jgi:gamma-glutamyltranspeptidase/glutathione hydrolase
LATKLAACIAEPILTSLSGRSFLLAQTPKEYVTEAGFFSIPADIGAAQQEFHIGMSSTATPGMVKKLFAMHPDLGSIPRARLVELALSLARDDLAVNTLQADIFGVVGAIYTANATYRDVFASRHDPVLPIGKSVTCFFAAFTSWNSIPSGTIFPAPANHEATAW